MSSNVVCWTYQQHSHNQNRNVWFSAHYRPTKDVTNTVYYILKPVIVPPSKAEANRPMNMQQGRVHPSPPSAGCSLVNSKMQWTKSLNRYRNYRSRPPWR